MKPQCLLYLRKGDDICSQSLHWSVSAIILVPGGNFASTWMYKYLCVAQQGPRHLQESRNPNPMRHVIKYTAVTSHSKAKGG